MPGRVEIALVPVLVGNDQGLGRPAYREARVVPSDAALAIGGIEGRDQIERLDILGQRQKAVGEAARYVHHAPIAGAELGAEALAEAGRARAQIEDRVPQGTL